MINLFFINRWVKPFYLSILNGNYCHLLDESERAAFIADVRKALGRVNSRVLAKLIDGHWREAITGSWFAGVLGKVDHRDRIGERLLASEACYAGQSHAFALACFADDASRQCLRDYLDQYLRKPECYYDQHWAMHALIWIDEQRGTDAADEFLKPDGLWDTWAREQGPVKLEERKEHFWDCMAFVREHFPGDNMAERRTR